VSVAIGAGGMGEVYRATDTRLKRDVAIKVLPASMSADADRLARFQREAEVLAALNHPHIAAIYGLEETDVGSGKTPVRALVMELVEGPTLADRIAQGALPLNDALAIARQIADALEAAHERGIIHRDLKPANIKVRPDGTVKVLDFGLAKALGHDAAIGSSDLANSPTITTPAMTQVGMILGTAAYMAPEQARGRAADKRADIWAFGCVLFEMLTGARAFPGDDVTDTLAAVVKLEPEWSVVGTEVPARVRQVLRVCLQKDPRQRGGDIAAIRLALDGAFETDAPRKTEAATSSSGRWIWLMSGTALVAGGLIVGLAAWSMRPVPEAPRVSRFTIEQPAGVRLQDGIGQQTVLALSPDGTKVAYRTPPSAANKLPRLVLRPVDALEATPIYEGQAVSPFFSPDGAWVGFFAIEGEKGVVRKVAITGGPAVTIGTIEKPQAPHGGTWGEDDTIIFAMHNRGLWRVSTDRSVAEPLTPETAPTADKKEPGSDHREWPVLLPDGRGLLYSDRPDGSTGAGASRILVRNLKSGEERVLISGGTSPQYVHTGHLVYAFDGTLRAVGFDLDRLEVVGTPRPVLDGVLTKSEGAAEFRVSRNGSLVYLTGAPASTSATLVWRDRSGRETPFGTGGLERAQHPRLSPDVRRLALSVAGDLWVYYVDGRPPIRLTTGSENLAPLWSPDGQRLVYEGGGAIWSIAADGSDSTPVKVSGAGHFHPHGWFNDGRDLLAVQLEGNSDIVRWPLSNPKDITAVVATPAAEGPLGASLSPDGRWLAYVSGQTGANEIWVRPSPGPGAPIRVSPSGGTDVTWARNGRELYYLSQGKMMAVSVGAGSTPSFSAPTALFDVAPFRLDNQPPVFDVTTDGRFIMLKRIDDGKSDDASRMVVVLNWSQELLRAPAAR
jgi:serine/threonine-protein kinase